MGEAMLIFKPAAGWKRFSNAWILSQHTSNGLEIDGLCICFQGENVCTAKWTKLINLQ